MSPTVASFGDLWALDPGVTFLNHGSFGACPRAVLAHQTELRARLESEPVRFMVREMPALLDQARKDLATFLGADAEGLAFVPNATSGVNAVLRSLEVHADDEFIVTDHAYNACRNVLDFVAARGGAKVRVARIPFPLADPSQVIDAVLAEVTDRTRLALLDHVTSTTALILPLAALIRRLHDRGVKVLVDGAHAPGMVPLNLGELGADWYTGNCHKWLCAPKGAAFLWVAEEHREKTRPAVISHGANMPTHRRSRFRQEFDWVGTLDPTPWLSVPKAISYLESLLPGGWSAIMRRNRDLVLDGRDTLSKLLGTPSPAPNECLGSMATVILPPGPSGEPSPLYTDPLQDELLERYKIEVPVGPLLDRGDRFLRISAQLYNNPADYARLGQALSELL